ncbi:MAG TPA: nuclear transport factor 2 family protein [Thermoleophilaceae bacterium]|nr:nuclear transport factor 2 family protein [Thermoleophilaceae bacterium]
MENVELIQRSFDSFNGRDLDAFLGLMDPEVEFTPYERALEGLGPYRGHDGVRTWWEEAFTALPEFRVEPREIRDLGDVTLTHGRLRGQGGASGAAFDRQLWHVAKWRDKRQIWWSAFESEADALEAVGLSE